MRRVAGVCVLISLLGSAIQHLEAQTDLPDAPHTVAVSEPTHTRAAYVDRYELRPGEDPQNHLGFPLLQHIAADQLHFWTAPSRFEKKDLRWILPFSGITAGLIASDSWMARQVPDSSSQLKRSQNISNYGAYSLLAAGGGSFLLGHMTNNDHLRETGLLAGEAVINSTAVAYALKTVTQRQRPLDGNGNGSFFQGGSSFPSEHSAIAWSVAGVVAHEYPGPLTKLAAYGLASAVTLTRVTGKEHFPSDVVIGSALGWYFAHEVYRAHHDNGLRGAAWGDLVEEPTAAEKGPRNPKNMGSPYVPLDSWIYPVFDRLAALGFTQGAHDGIRPWTRMECARLVDETTERVRYEGQWEGEAGKLLNSLAVEFAPETARLNGAANLAFSVDSVYTRVTGISGPPLSDSYHFAQTIGNDFGRPYGEGFNSIAGLTAHAVAGPLSVEVQGEYQQAPSTPSYTSAVQQAIANLDGTLPLPNGTGSISRFQLMNAAVGLTFSNIKISFGRSSSWFGPSETGSLIMSDNATPVTALTIDTVSPFRVPLLSRLLGPARTDFFVGQLSGHHWVFDGTKLLGPTIDPQPFIHANKISFKPTENLEFGMGFTAIFGGPGLPFTWSNFLRSFYSHKASIAENPGKRASSFDLSYRIPGLRNWVTFYLDSLVVDEISPILSSRPSVNPGLYFPRIPKVPKLDLRVEGIDTDHHDHHFGPGFVYTDRRYRDGYTSDGNILGNYIGRDGTGGQAWATYWFTTRNRLQMGFRHIEVDRDFLQGGHANDFSVRSDWMLTPGIAVSGFLQYERWAFPLLAPVPKSDVTASFQITYTPHWRIH